MSDLVPVRRALISVSDKSGLAEFATALVREFNVELISTGGTAKFLREQGLAVVDVSEVTGFPEMMDGRVKTLHPKIHGGLLALRDNAEHAAAMKAHDIKPIDLVVINLYPFEQTIAKPGVSFEEAIENIDIGGPSMVRSAAKNHGFVLVVTSPDRYEKVLGDLREHKGSSCGKHRLKQAQRAFAHTAEYDAKIAGYLATQVPGAAESPLAWAGTTLPGALCGNYARQQSLRYGENPHQPAALYVNATHPAREASVARATQHHGKELSYINLLDADAALSVVKEFAQPAACVVKHATPCGVGAADDLATAFERAYTSDPLAAFGGIVALNRPVDEATAARIVDGNKFLEVVVAPGYTPAALETLKARWKNVRLLEVAGSFTPDAAELSMHNIVGGILIQARDLTGLNESDWKVVSNRQPTAAELDDLRFAWLACKHVKSNAIVVARGGATVGIGGGQVDRVNAARIAITKAADRAKGAAAASDAFFPFPDGPALLLDAGVTAIIQPGGSVKDSETIDLVNARGATLVLTGQRHFRH
ncbi:MAG TPA: bifunctional phosphoribosylaminoimidazolecarboxamide formyltransferase/IMP cyclohydrolase [Tepidisphaeraceae bacterium]|jgi:phosphoribosylaminoimidazolecarboxamide formyltransferase/IMP cyclohydrolase|nr:bifunctional phosphoribosylaminoimidazolecarboxamide formyltransferase/IMP cyclohydrolase [Tepidisphaeraceae bacterium]